VGTYNLTKMMRLFFALCFTWGDQTDEIQTLSGILFRCPVPALRELSDVESKEVETDITFIPMKGMRKVRFARIQRQSYGL
jgi:hypothetical protein